jgi:hypothetical protein
MYVSVPDERVCRRRYPAREGLCGELNKGKKRGLSTLVTPVAATVAVVAFIVATIVVVPPCQGRQQRG